jgi:3-oxoacyl-[acyl-carrier-protein] synthase II
LSRNVVVTGIGIIAPPGADVETFHQSCLQTDGPVTTIPEHWCDYHTYRSTVYAPLPDFKPKQYGLTRIDAMQLSTCGILAYCATRQALDNAQLGLRATDEKKGTFAIENIDSTRAGVFAGTGIGGVTALIDNEGNHILSPLEKHFQQLGTEPPESLKRKPPKFNPFVVSMTMPNACSALLGVRLGLHGRNATFTSACAAGTVALGNAFRAIRDGELDMVIAGGVDYLADRYGGIFRGFDSAKTLAVSDGDITKANRPFDTSRSGFLFAEGGAAFLVLEHEDHAAARGAIPIAGIRGYGETFDAHSMMMLDPDAAQIRRMIDQTLQDAEITSNDISYINTHGTGPIGNDETESRLIADTFRHGPTINATKSITGHAVGAGGAIEAAVSCLSIRDQAVHGCRNLENPVRDLNFARKTQSCDIAYALTQSFAFGGHNAGLILGRV